MPDIPQNNGIEGNDTLIVTEDYIPAAKLLNQNYENSRNTRNKEI